MVWRLSSENRLTSIACFTTTSTSIFGNFRKSKCLVISKQNNWAPTTPCRCTSSHCVNHLQHPCLGFGGGFCDVGRCHHGRCTSINHWSIIKPLLHLHRISRREHHHLYRVQPKFHTDMSLQLRHPSLVLTDLTCQLSFCDLLLERRDCDRSYFLRLFGLVTGINGCLLTPWSGGIKASTLNWKFQQHRDAFNGSAVLLGTSCSLRSALTAWPFCTSLKGNTSRTSCENGQWTPGTKTKQKITTSRNHTVQNNNSGNNNDCQRLSAIWLQSKRQTVLIEHQFGESKRPKKR